MFEVGFGEFIVVVLVALVVFGPEKMAESAEKLGRIVAGFKKNWQEFNSISSAESVEKSSDNE
jgi:TatA/E family protein of Tat protein translocase